MNKCDCRNCKSNIEDFLECGVSDDVWKKIIDKEVPLIEIFDQNAVYDYIISEHEKFCDQEGICSECMSPLILEKQVEEYWGDKMVINKGFICPHGCL